MTEIIKIELTTNEVNELTDFLNYLEDCYGEDDLRDYGKANLVITTRLLYHNEVHTSDLKKLVFLVLSDITNDNNSPNIANIKNHISYYRDNYHLEPLDIFLENSETLDIIKKGILEFTLTKSTNQ